MSEPAVQYAPVPEENKMGTMPINRLLLSMSLPMMISMLVQALYNVVDSMFVSFLSENALTAVGLAFPMQNFMISVAVGTGVGMNAFLSRSLGEGNREQANLAAGNGLFLQLASSLLFVLIGLFGLPLFLKAQTDIPEIIAYGEDYLSVCCILSFGLFGQVAFSRILQSTGKTFCCMIIQLVGAIINIILDPIMIFGLFGFPRMEVAGAALATVFGQIVATIMGLCLNLRCNPEIKLTLASIRPRLPMVGRIYAVGIPSIALSSIGSVMTFGMNRILMAFTPTATAVFNVYFKLQSFVFMPVFGLNNAMVPIISYNFGAKKPDRILQTFRLSAIYAVTILLAGLAIFQLAPDKLLALFNADEMMLAIGIPALKTISLSYIFPGFCIVTISMCQALGHGLKSLLVSVVRQLVVLLPTAWFFSLAGNLDRIWLAFPAAELSAAVMCVFVLLYVYRKEIKPLYQC